LVSVVSIRVVDACAAASILWKLSS